VNPKVASKAPSSDVTPSRLAALESLDRLSGKRTEGKGPEGAADAGEILDLVSKEIFLSAEDRALSTELLYGVLRHQGYLDAWIARFASPPLRRLSPKILIALRLAFYQILFLERVPSSAAVNTAVQWVKHDLGQEPAGLVNAVLREALRHPERFKLPDPDREAVDYLSIKYSHPSWMVRRWLTRLGREKAEALLQANNAIPPLTLRVNTLRLTREALAEEVQRLGGKAEPTDLSPVGLSVRGIVLRQLPSFARGGFYIQDEAAQLVSYLVGPLPGERVLDVCAAPGGKTTHLAELMEGKGKIVAWDFSPDRLSLLRENLRRMGGEEIVSVRRSDTLAVEKDPEAPYDRILLDAPCSGLGILRRTPEGKWKKGESMIRYHSDRQKRMIEQIAPLLREGGRLVFATCSTEPEENEEVIEWFLSRHPDFKLLPVDAVLPPSVRERVTSEGYLNTLLNPYRMDFFFAACLQKEKGKAG
jgi:16S rRNA (cytosine967-C5)-methyltransferase